MAKLNKKTIRVLIIEDDPDQQILLSKNLSRSSIFSYEVQCVDTLNACSSYLDDGNIDLVFLDLNLPDCKDVATMQWMHANYPNVPVVVVTAVDEVEKESLVMKSGAQDYIVKGKTNIDTLDRIVINSIERFKKIYLINAKHQELSQVLESIRQGEVDTILTSHLPSGALNVQDMQLAQENQKLLNELEEMANRDSLTGLPNRFSFENTLKTEINRSVRRNRQFALLFIDLDQFKGVNDTKGHDVGDELLKVVAMRLNRCLRESDFVARFGGDEFGIILPDIVDISGVAIVCQKVIDEISEVIKVRGVEVRVGASIGVAIFPKAGTDLQTLMKHADLSLYRVKASGRNSYQFYQEDLDNAYKRRLRLQSDLKVALCDGSLYLRFQPIVYLKTRYLAGLEANMCWDHADFGKIMPEEFISIAESSGLLDELSDWLLESVCKEARNWCNFLPPIFIMGLTISARQLTQHDWAKHILSTLTTYGIPHSAFRIEITETPLQENLQFCGKQLNILHDNGVQVSIDELGAGYSSLMRLANLPISSLKIDVSLVRDVLNNQTYIQIIKSVISMAKCLNIKTLAKGVSSDAIADFLLDVDCSMAWGSYFGHALKCNEVKDYLTQYLEKRPVMYKISIYDYAATVRKVGHDMNNALAGISGYTELLQKSKLPNNNLLEAIALQAEQIIQLMQRQSQEIRAITDNNPDEARIAEIKSIAKRTASETNKLLTLIMDNISQYKNKTELAENNLRMAQRVFELTKKGGELANKLENIDDNLDEVATNAGD